MDQMKERLIESHKIFDQKIFSLHDFNLYFTENYDDNYRHFHYVYQQSKVPLSRRAASAGGKVRLHLDRHVNLIIVEPENLERIALTFTQWRDAIVQGNILTFREQYQRTLKNSTLVKKEFEPKNKREKQLLRQHILKTAFQKQVHYVKRISEIITKNLPVHFLPQLYQSDPSILELLLEVDEKFKDQDLSNQKYNNRRKVNRTKKSRQQHRRDQISLHQLNKELAFEDDYLINDFTILYHLFNNPNCLWLTCENIETLCRKFFYFSMDFNFKGQLKYEIKEFGVKSVSSQLMIFNPIGGRGSKKYPHAHIFPLKNDYQGYRDPNGPGFTPVALVPKLRLDLKRGPLVLDDNEYEQTMKNYEKFLKDWEKNLSKLDQKVPDDPAIKIPEPHRKHNYCSLCHIFYENYLEHIDSDAHNQKIFEKDNFKYLQQIDKEIEELKQEQLFKSISQPKRDLAPPPEQDESYMMDSHYMSLATQSQSNNNFSQVKGRQLYKAQRNIAGNRTKQQLQLQEKPKITNQRETEVNNIKEAPLFGKRKRQDNDFISQFQSGMNLNKKEENFNQLRGMKQELDSYDHRFDHYFQYDKQLIAPNLRMFNQKKEFK